MKLVVTDTGPLLHLHEIGALSLLAHLGTVHVTPVVWRELLRHAPALAVGEPPAWLRLENPCPITAHKAARWVTSGVLHAGEAEALAYALEIHADIFLTDDAAARTLGESLGVHVRGSLGVVLQAAASGYWSEKHCSGALQDLFHHSSLWISGRVRAAAVNALALLFKKK